MTFSEQLTENFYHWERYCRGWYIYENQVQLEPPFTPFKHLSLTAPFKDDGLAPSIFKQISNLFHKPKEDQELIFQDWEPFLDESVALLKSFSISLSQLTSIKSHITEQLILMLSLSQCPISFEIIGDENKIYFQIVCRDIDLRYIQHQIKGFFPGIIFTDTTDTIHDEKYLNIPTCIIDFGLKEEVMRPLNVSASFDPDPLTGIIFLLETLQFGELAIVQIQFSGVVNPWAMNLMKAVTVNGDESFFSNAPEMVSLAKLKTASPLVASNIKIICQSQDKSNAVGMANALSRVLKQCTSSPYNSLMELTIPEYNFEMRFEDFLDRKSHKLGMLLNIKELQTLLHFPNSSIVSNKLLRDVRRTKAVKASNKNDDFILGVNQHQGVEHLVKVSSDQRLRHTHVIGATGTGKSTFLITQIVQDIILGNGLAVIDPHGDLIEAILKRIPSERLDDVILVDPADTEFPVGFNILSAHSDIEGDILSSDLVAVFRRLSTSWGDQMNSVFANAILAILESNQGGTLVDLRRFLIEKDFRESFLKTIADPSIIYYWQKEYPLLKSTSVGPILTRLDAFLRPKVIRSMVAQNKSLDFENILDSGKILLVKLSQGLMGTENSYLLGSFFITKFYQAAMARQSQANETRKDFFVYIDEFQNFITPSMSAMLSGARKYHLGLILAHQDMQQLVKQDSELASSIISNAGIRTCFRLGDIDAKKFEAGFSFFEAKDLQNLGTGESICRIDRSENDFNMVSLTLPEQIQEDIDLLREQSRQKYGTPRNEVEESLKDLLQGTNSVSSEVRNINVQPIQSSKNPEVLKEREKIDIAEPIDQQVIEDTKQHLVKKQVETDHRYLQNLIKKMAESRGFKAIIEDPLSNNQGLVDVSLERNGKRIACEISVSTTEKWEVHNIEKCINAGYDQVISCSNNPVILDKIKTLVQITLPIETQKKVFFFSPEELVSFLHQQLIHESSGETKVKGYRVKVEFDSISPSEMAEKRNSVAKMVFDSFKKKRPE